MTPTVSKRLADVPLKTLKARLPADEADLKPLEDPGGAIQKALARAGISQKEAALTMAINEGQLTRQLKGQEHLSWQRLFKLPDAFWCELLVVLAEMRGLATVRTQIQWRRRA